MENSASSKKFGAYIGACWGDQQSRFFQQFPRLLWLPKNLERGLGSHRPPVCVCPLSMRTLQTYAAAGALRDLAPLFAEAEFRDRWSPAALDLAATDGKHFAIPEDIRPYALQAKRKILRKYGLRQATTRETLLDQFLFVSKKIRTPVVGVFPGGPSHQLGIMLAAFGAGGIALGDFRLDDPADLSAAREAFTWLSRLPLDWRVFFDSQSVQALSHIYQGKCPFLLRWLLGSVVPDEDPAAWSITPFPKAAGVTRPLRYVGMSGWCSPLNDAPEELAFSALRAILDPAFVLDHEKASSVYFHADARLWRNAELRRCRPLYRTAATFFADCELRLFDVYQSDHLSLLDTLRIALESGFDADAWLALVEKRIVTKRSTEPPLVFRHAVRYIDAHLARIRKSADIAQAVSRTERHLNRLFQAEVGESCGQYLRRKRLEEARKLLLQTTLLSKEIAYRVGFRSVSTFTKAFKAEFHQSPSSLRR